MEHAEQFLGDGKLGSLGAGLAGTRKLADQFQIQSAANEGTTVTLDFWKREVVG